MADNAKIICPLMGEECIADGAIRMKDGVPEMVKCRFWVIVQGQDPQTGQIINNGDCAFCWNPVLMIENSKVNRETGAAVESFRNEMVKANNLTQTAVLIGKNLLPPNVERQCIEKLIVDQSDKS